MANCKKCGNHIEDGKIFCDKCKNDFGDGVKKTVGGFADIFRNAEDFTNAYSKADIEKNKLYAVLCYIPIICFYPVFAKSRHSAFVRFHANQGLTLFILEILVSALFYGLAIIPVVGSILRFPLSVASSFVNLLMLFLMVYGGGTAYLGLAKVIPVIGKIRFFKA